MQTLQQFAHVQSQHILYELNKADMRYSIPDELFEYFKLAA